MKHNIHTRRCMVSYLMYGWYSGGRAGKMEGGWGGDGGKGRQKVESETFGDVRLVVSFLTRQLLYTKNWIKCKQMLR